MNGLCFAPATNKPGLGDADEFRRQAHAFAKFHGMDAERVVVFDNDQPKRRRRVFVLEHLERFQHLECVAFFCHGWVEGIQAGFSLDETEDLANALHEACEPNAVIPLYCCSTAGGEAPGGDGGFADTLRDELRGKLDGARVDAHATKGHCTNNPRVRRFAVNDPTGKGGEWIVPPDSPLFHRWAIALAGDLRFRFPFMSIEAIRGSL